MFEELEVLEVLSDWRIYIPFYIAIYRWSLFLFLRIFPSMFYRQLKYKRPVNVDPATYIRKSDVTVVIPVYQPPDCFDKTISSIIKNGIYKIIVVADVTCVDQVKQICNEYENVEVISEDKPGKRPALATGIRHTTTRIVALVDDDVQWSNNFLEKLIAPFQHSARIGGVGCKHISRIESFCDVWRIMADMRLAVRFLELMATTVMDRGASCISGRTACYLTEILQTDEFYNYFLNEKFLGMSLQSGDDKCVTRYIINKGYKTYHQLRNTCMLSTTFERGTRFFIQMLRWARNTWRSDLKAVFTERYIWCNNPVTAFILLDKMFTPFFMIYGITYLPYYAISNNEYIVLIAWFAWVLFSRTMKLCYYFWEHPRYIIYLPLFIVFQYVQAFVRVWALLTLYNRNWGTRTIKYKGNQVIRDDVKIDIKENKERYSSSVIMDPIVGENEYQEYELELKENPIMGEKSYEECGLKIDFDESSRIFELEKKLDKQSKTLADSIILQEQLLKEFEIQKQLIKDLVNSQDTDPCRF